MVDIQLMAILQFCLQNQISITGPSWKKGEKYMHNFGQNYTKTSYCTLFESENERQKIEPVPISLPRVSRSFPDVKTRNAKNSIIGHQR